MKVYESEREFKKDNPSGLYVCPLCGQITNSAYFCNSCGTRADGLLGTFGKGFFYQIGETEHEIFTPIEQVKGDTNG